jgi:hypothetical protein
MFYKFDNFTNRLARTTPQKANNPAGLIPTTRDLFHEPEFHFESSKVKPVKMEADVRYIHGAAPGQAASHGTALGTVPSSEGYARVQNLQKLWTASESLMVWQKRGMRDVGPYYATMGLCAVGAAYCFYLIAAMSFPKKPE